MNCDSNPLFDPAEEAALSDEVRSLLGVDAIYTQVLAAIEDLALEDALPDPAKRMLIRLEQPIRMGDLARASNLLPSTVTSIVDMLEDEGLAERQRDPSDRRAWLLSLTEKGQATRAELVEKASEIFHAVTGFDSEDTEAFARLMDKARKNIHETLLDRSRK